MKQHKLFIWILVTLFVFDGFLWTRVFSSSDPIQNAVYFFDVGQGDSALVVASNGQKVLIDGGREGSGLEAELNKVIGGQKYIDLLIMSHGDFDHYGGFLDILDSYEVGAFIGSGRAEEKDSYDALMSKVEDKNIPYVILGEADRIVFQDEYFEILSPSGAEILSDDLNDTSLVMLFEGESFSALFTGDAGIATERRLVREYDLSADVLKAGHHGSKTSSDQSFVRELAPLISIISVGENTYGHPDSGVLEILGLVSQIFRTDEVGTIKVLEDRGELIVERF